MNSITVRPAKLADIPQLLLFEQAVIEAERPMDNTIKESTTTYYDLNNLYDSPKVELAVAEIGNKIIASGYARIEEAKGYNKHELYAYLGFMYVVPEHRGKGINKIILEHLMDWCRTQEVFEIRLDVYSSNTAAINAYKKVGFVPNLLNMRVELKK